MKNRFNTNEYVRGLTIAGFSRAQAEANGGASASRADLAAAEQRLQRRIAAASDERRSDIRKLRRDFAIAAAAMGILLIALGIGG